MLCRLWRLFISYPSLNLIQRLRAKLPCSNFNFQLYLLWSDIQTYQLSLMDQKSTVTFTKDELIEITKQTIGDLISSDPLLKDLPKDVTLEEITAQLALQHGQSMTIFVKKDNGDKLPIVVPVKATVLDLKRAIRRHVTLSRKRSGQSSKISWNYVWKNNTLVSEQTKLEDDNETLSELGLSNKSSVSFCKRLRHKNCSRQRQRR